MKDIKNKSIKDLLKLVSEKQDALKAFRFGSAGSKVKNVKEGRNIRKDIARLMTELSAQSNEPKVVVAESEAKTI